MWWFHLHRGRNELSRDHIRRSEVYEGLAVGSVGILSDVIPVAHDGFHFLEIWQRLHSGAAKGGGVPMALSSRWMERRLESPKGWAAARVGFPQVRAGHSARQPARGSAVTFLPLLSRLDCCTYSPDLG